MEFFLWSRAAVGQLIEQECGIKFHIRSVGKYLARWGFTPQKPIKRTYKQSPAAVQAWLEGDPRDQSRQDKTRWMIIDGAFGVTKLIEFLAALIKEAAKKVFLILDNLRVHHSKIVKAWVAERSDQIELFYLPGYDRRKSPWDSP